LEFIAIKESGDLEKPALDITKMAKDVVAATVQLYRSVGYQPPWIGYLVFEEDTCVGACGFKAAPHNNRVEIAYFTFPGHESRGVATQMASELISIALNKAPNLTVTAQTLPEENASTSVLKKLQFVRTAALEHPEDGLVWEWELR
jgi:[ribosomal protein S5]-alanine N-acetyltransferase